MRIRTIIDVTRRPKNALDAKTHLGPFGGGWKYSLGVQIGPKHDNYRSIVVNLWRRCYRVTVDY